MKFQQICAGDQLTPQMATEVVKKSPLLAGYIEFFKKPGNAVNYRKGGTVGGIVGNTRALGDNYTGHDMAPDYGTASRKMLGDTVRLDVAYERMGYDLASEMNSQLTRRVRDLAYMFNYALIKGDPSTDSKQFAGLEELVTSQRVVSMGINGAQITLGNSDTSKKAQQIFLEKLDETIALCEGTNKVVMANAQTLARINAIAREYLTIQRNEFGVPITLYNQVPLINMGDYQADAVDSFKPIIGFDETCGTSVDCASLYVASFEEEDGVSFATCDGGFTVYPVQKVGNFYECMFELIADSALVRASALSKLEGIRL